MAKHREKASWFSNIVSVLLVLAALTVLIVAVYLCIFGSVPLK